MKAILVTGASTGIGNHITRYLAGQGHVVFATARKEADLTALAHIDNVVPLELDVTNPQQIREAVEHVERCGQGLYGLVNNAGIGELGSFVTWTDAEMQRIFDVNVFGPFRMSNAFMKMLIVENGRIVNIGSQGGMITKKYFGPYTMTKFALEAYTEALAEELQPYGVRVSIVQPGGIATNIGPNSMPATLARFRRGKPPFKHELDQVLAAFENPTPPQPDAAESEANRKPSSAEIVVTAVSHALFSDAPKLRYLVGTKWEGDRVINALIEKLIHENDNPHHSYTRDELVALLDQHWSANQKPDL